MKCLISFKEPTKKVIWYYADGLAQLPQINSRVFDIKDKNRKNIKLRLVN